MLMRSSFVFVSSASLLLLIFFANTVSAALTVTINTPTNIIADTGQYVIFTASLANQGSTPYTYNFVVYNSFTSVVIANMLFTNSLTTNTFLWQIPAADAGNTVDANVVAMDNSGGLANSIVTPPVGITPATITVNTLRGFFEPAAVAFNPYNGFAYVTDEGSTTVNVINIAQNKTVNTIKGFSEPQVVAFNPSGTLAYVTNDGGPPTVNVINVAQNKTVNTITGFSTPYGIAFNPSGSLVYITNYGGTTVSVVNTVTNSVVNTITGFSEPRTLAFNPSGSLVYVTNYGTAQVKVVNTVTNSIVNTINVGSDPQDIVINPSGTTAYVTSGSSTVSIINTGSNTVTNTITEFSGPYDIALNLSGTLAYVTNINNGTVSVVNTISNAIVNTIIVGTAPVGIAFNPTGTIAYVANYDGSTVSVLHPVSYITINKALSTPTIYPSSNSGYSLGQTITFASYELGGSLPNTYNFIVYNSATHIEVANMLTSSSNTFAYTIPSGEVGNTLDANVFVTDSASTPVTVNSILSGAITVNSPLSASLTASNTVLDSRQTETYTVSASGGTPPYTYNFFNVTGITTMGVSTSNTFSFVINDVTPGVYLSYNVIVTDSSPTNAVANTLTNTIIVNPALSATILPSSGSSYNTGQIVTFTATIPEANTLPLAIDGLAYDSSFSGASIDTVPLTTSNSPDLIVVYVGSEGPVSSTQISSISDSYGLQWHERSRTILTSDAFSNYDDQEVWYAIAYTPLDTDNIDITLNNQIDSAAVIEFGVSGVNTMTPWDTDMQLPANVVSTSGTAQVTVPVSTSNAHDMLLGAVGTDGAPNWVPGSGYTLLQDAQDGIGNYYWEGAVEYAIVKSVQSATSVSFTPTGYDFLLQGDAVQQIQNTTVGTPSYTYNFIVYNSATNIEVANMLTSSNTFAYTIPSAEAGETLYANVFVTDSASTQAKANSILSGVITVSGGASTATTTIPQSSGGGVFGSGGSGVYSSTSSIATTIPATTTIAQNTTISAFNINVSGSSTKYIYFNQSGATLGVAANGYNGTVTISLRNVTSGTPPAPVNYTKIVAINITTNNTSVLLNITLKYPCGTPSSYLQPFILVNGTWEPITPFTVDASSCSVSFVIPGDPVVALAEHIPPTSATTSVQAVSTSSQQTTSIPGAPTTGQGDYAVYIIVAIVIIAAVAYLISRRAKKAR